MKFCASAWMERSSTKFSSIPQKKDGVGNPENRFPSGKSESTWAAPTSFFWGATRSADGSCWPCTLHVGKASTLVA